MPATFGNLTASLSLATVCAASLITEQAVAAPGGSTVVGPAEILQTGLSLALIVAAIVALAWLVSRLQGGRVRNGSAIRVLASQALGAKERVMLVNVGESQLLLGVTATQIRTLHVLDKPVSVAEQSMPTVAFAERLRALMAGANR